MIGKPVFVEHTGLFINSLNGFPGGLTQIFWDRLQAERFSELIGRLGDPAAEARTLIGYCDGRKRHFFEGVVPGRISPSPAGHGGFEWDDVFIPEGQNQTFAQLGTQKNGRPCAVARWMPSSPFCGSPDASWTSCATPTATID